MKRLAQISFYVESITYGCERGPMWCTGVVNVA